MSNNVMFTKLKNIVVVGQGAIGLLWYHHLSQENHDAKQKYKISLLASNQSQLTTNEWTAAKYQFTAYHHTLTETHPLFYAEKVDIKQADIIILCVKSYQISAVLQQIVKDISGECMLIFAHNGMGIFEEVAQILPSKQPILAMLTTHGCLRNKALSIEHTGLGHSDIGLLSGELRTMQKKNLTKLLNNSLPEVSFHEDIIEKQWLKLAINCVINPITALNDISNGEVNDERFILQVKQLLTEITKISQKEGIHLTLSDLQVMVTKVAQATTKNCSSMRGDVLAGKPTEVDYINGYIHRLGKKHNIATPENTRMWQQILKLNDSVKL